MNAAHLPELVTYLIAVNLLAAGLMAWDKLSAMRRSWRVPEASLFALALLGASPTVFLLIRYLRHKSRKPRFLRALDAIILLQLMGIAIGLFLLFSG